MCADAAFGRPQAINQPPLKMGHAGEGLLPVEKLPRYVGGQRFNYKMEAAIAELQRQQQFHEDCRRLGKKHRQEKLRPVAVHPGAAEL